MRIIVYTDGSALTNPHGIGGWAAILRTEDGQFEKILSGAAPDTTSNRMEMTAVWEALKAIKHDRSEVTICIDSEYVMHGFTKKWVNRWQDQNWRSGKKQVANVDLWQKLLSQVKRFEITWQHVKGHSKIELNEKCDRLAYRAAVNYRDSLEEQNEESIPTSSALLGIREPGSTDAADAVA